MLNYFGNKIEVKRYVVGFILISLSYSFGRSAALKQLSKSMGIKHYGQWTKFLALLECVGFVSGSTWGIASILSLKSIFTTILSAVVLMFIVLAITLLKVDRLLQNHWSY